MPPRNLTGPLRLALIGAVVLVVTGIVIIAGNQLFTLQARLAEQPVWVRWAWWAVAVGIVVAATMGLARLLFPPRAARPGTEVPDEPSLRAEVTRWEGAGVDVSAAHAELAELERRREAGRVVVAVYGEISAGKSSLIRALLPEAEIAVDVVGGTTQAVRHYQWESPDGDRLVFADMPGFGDIPGAGDPMAADEARRAHLVLFVAEGDLTRGEWQALRALQASGKPLVLALNKSDRYDEAEQAAIRERLRERLGDDTPVVPVVAGGREEVVRRDPDDRETRVERERPADVRELRRALQAAIDRRGGGIETLRDRAVFLLTARKLEGAVQAHRRDAAEAIVSRYARRAVVGALAAVAPGSDIIIQGALAAALVRELCGLYRVEVREVALDRLVDGLRRRAGSITPLLLGVAGNALKAFPGLGTLTGGLVHAVAYGLLFRTAGRAIAESLEQRGTLQADDALSRFEERLREDMATPARELARLALEERPAGDGERADRGR